MQGMYARIQEAYPQISPICADFPVPAAEPGLSEIGWPAPSTPCLRSDPIRPRRNHQSKITNHQFKGVPPQWLWYFSHFFLALPNNARPNAVSRFDEHL